MGTARLIRGSVFVGERFRESGKETAMGVCCARTVAESDPR